VTQVAGRVAVVTGGASGIGRGIAEALLERGASVVVADIEQAALDAAVAELRSSTDPTGASPATVAGCRVDVSDAESVEALRDFVLERFGRVDIVCLNAGVGPSGRIRDLTRADWEWILGVNLWGVIHGVAAFLPALEANGDGGHLQVTGSHSSFVPLPTIGSYTVTKYGVAALVETLAAELAEDGSRVRVSLLAPGMVRTNIGTSSRNRPRALEGALEDVDISQGINQGIRWMSPRTAGRIAVRAIERDELYAPTDPSLWPAVERRFEAIREAYSRYPAWEDE